MGVKAPGRLGEGGLGCGGEGGGGEGGGGEVGGGDGGGGEGGGDEGSSQHLGLRVQLHSADTAEHSQTQLSTCPLEC